MRLATKVCDYRAEVTIFLIIFVERVSCLPFSKAGTWQSYVCYKLGIAGMVGNH